MTLFIASAHPATVHAETGDRTPSKLWRAYPLVPGGGKTRIPTEPGAERVDVVGGSPRARTGPGDEPPPPPSAGRSSKKVLLTVVGLSLVGLLIAFIGRAAARGNLRGGLARVADGIVSPIRSLAADGPPMSWRPRLTSVRPISIRPAKKGSIIMSLWRKPEQTDKQDVSVDSAQDPPATGEEETNLVGRTSPYAVIEDVDEHDDSRGGSAGGYSPEDVVAADPEEAAAVAAVGTEVQTILLSAKEAAAKIRRSAEEEAERIRNEAMSAAEAESGEAKRSAEATRTEVDRIRAEAEAYAMHTQTAADAAAEQRLSEADRQAAQILDEVERRRDAVDAELAHKVEQTEEEARQRVEMLSAEIERQEERLDSILVVLRGMSSQLAGVLGRQEESDDLADVLGNFGDKTLG
jgi:hypothetical protein